MPTDVVQIDLRSQVGAIVEDTYSDLLTVASEPTIADPLVNTPIRYRSATSAATDFGSGSDAHIASQNIQRMGAESWMVLMLETTTHTETIAGSETAATSSGVLQNGPVHGGVENVTVNVDGVTQTVLPTAETPPTPPATGEVALNFDTSELVTGTASSGTGTGIEVSYETASWDSAESVLPNTGADIMTLADTRVDESHLGDLNQLVSFADQNSASVVAHYRAQGYDDDFAARDAAHRISSYIPSGVLLPFAAKTNDDAASRQAGRLTVKPAHFDPYLDGYADYALSLSGQIRQDLIGTDNERGTFEGGDERGLGATNVLQVFPGTTTQALHNSVTPAGLGSAYHYFDVARTERFVENEIRQSLLGLQLRLDKIPFSEPGGGLIEDAIVQRLQQYVSSGGVTIPRFEQQQVSQGTGGDGTGGSDSDGTAGGGEVVTSSTIGIGALASTGTGGTGGGTAATTGVSARSGPQDINSDVSPGETQAPPGDTGTDDPNAPLAELVVDVPFYDDIPADDKRARVWSGIAIRGTLSANAHTFEVGLDLVV